jgi:hypothetical protein
MMQTGVIDTLRLLDWISVSENGVTLVGGI